MCLIWPGSLQFGKKNTHTLNVEPEHPSVFSHPPQVSSETWSVVCWKLGLHLLADQPLVSGVTVYFALVCHPGSIAFQWEDSVCDSCLDNYSACPLIISSWLPAFKQMLCALRRICAFLLIDCDMWTWVYILIAFWCNTYNANLDSQKININKIFTIFLKQIPLSVNGHCTDNLHKCCNCPPR